MNSNEPLASAASSQATPSPELIPCHLMIPHPEQPKFLVIKHADGQWSPPLLRMPKGRSLMYNTANINRAMMKKYRLRTTILRIVVEAPNYALFEVEVHSSSSQQMEAVWVGSEEYAQNRPPENAGDDPISLWLKERESGLIPGLRSPWMLPGWYKEAEQWFSSKLVELGIQATGSTQQFKGGVPSACLLRTATGNGHIFFKASYAKQPGEARLTRLLAERWPEHVPAPLAVSEPHNWMISRDFKITTDNMPGVNDLAEFSATLGRLQLESINDLQSFSDMGCMNRNLEFLCNADGSANAQATGAVPVLKGGKVPLVDEELKNLEKAFALARDECKKLQAYEIPDSFSHLDYRPDNFFVEDNVVKIIDWADVAIAHPFMSLCRTIDYLELYTQEGESLEGFETLSREHLEEMQSAYLKEFEKFESIERLNEAFNIARKVFTLFYFHYLIDQLQVVEAGTPHGQRLQFLLCGQARKMIAQATG